MFIQFMRISKDLKPFTRYEVDVYKENTEPVVLTESRSVSQADIMQVFKFKQDNSLKTKHIL